MIEDDVLAEQIAYYRHRSGEYDSTAYETVEAAFRRIERIVGELAPTGRVLKIACGTGMWTGALAESAESVTALDSSPEVIEIARRRVTATNVRFEVADVFAYDPPERYDVIFFSAWLSHVPASRFAEFWGRLAGLLADGGRVLFNDEHVDEQSKERYVEGREEIVERTLSDGSTYRIVKNFIDPDAMAQSLNRLGWTATLRRDGPDWVLGEARRAT